MDVTVLEGSVRALAPSHPGAALLYIGELNFVTDIVGDSPEFAFRLAIPATSLLLNDDISGKIEGGQYTTTTAKGMALWKVSYPHLPVRVALRNIYRTLGMLYFLR